MPKISVIVPVYKVEKYLRRCVDSILAQTFTDFELILVDDGSPDNCPQICDEYAQKDSRVHVVHKQNGGLSDARNVGIEWVFANSDSEWITFIDSDDWVHKDLLTRLHYICGKYQSFIAICGLISVKGEEDCLTVPAKDVCEIWNTQEYWLQHTTNAMVAVGKIYHKSLLTSIRYPIGRIYEDGFTTHKLLFEHDEIPVIKQNLYYYYVNENGITHSAFSIKNYDGIIAKKERKVFFLARGYERLASAEESGIKIEIAYFSLCARKAGIYKEVPKEYRIGRIKALWTLYRMLNNDQFESQVYPYYPRLVKILAYWKRIKEWAWNKKQM